MLSETLYSSSQISVEVTKNLIPSRSQIQPCGHDISRICLEALIAADLIIIIIRIANIIDVVICVEIISLVVAVTITGRQCVCTTPCVKDGEENFYRSRYA